ncbi:MAG TPA: endonuclease/exonuclease/phosphatase family protein [Rhodothermales bacterium]|nr:endonuclease/exonuclease/phosphatase family protein [Rhodothermales bacterium]
MLDTLALVAAVLVATLTFASLLPVDWWGIRALDFPRLQLFVLCLIALAGLVATHGLAAPPLVLAVEALTLGAAVYQGARIAPYTRLWPQQVRRASSPGPSFRLLIANVLMDNRDATRLLAQIRSADADVVVLTEPDDWWADQLKAVHAAYPHRVEMPQPDTYGMIVLSRLPLIAPEVKRLVEPDIPSVHAQVELDGHRVALRFVHPKPPAPQEAESTEERDAELVMVGREVKRHRGPAIVAGDLNDVAWSRTTSLFQRISSTLDPRRGRGLFSTFHARHRLMRWPLDHVFHTAHFTLERLERLGYNGSDHFPMFVALRLTPREGSTQRTPHAGPGDTQEAQEKVEEARGDG